MMVVQHSDSKMPLNDTLQRSSNGQFCAKNISYHNRNLNVMNDEYRQILQRFLKIKLEISNAFCISMYKKKQSGKPQKEKYGDYHN